MTLYLSPSTFWQQGAVPFLVSATSGTTVLGAFDPLEAIADVCQRHGLWLHVDVSGTWAWGCGGVGRAKAKAHVVPPAPQAAWGGSVLLSQTHKHLLDGIQRCIQSPSSQIPPFKPLVQRIIMD